MAQARYNRNKRRNKNSICTNCGKSGHEYRDCVVPITSWGVILVRTGSRHRPTHKPDVKIYSSLHEYEPYKSKIKIGSDPESKKLCSMILDCVSFLMISRKHSLGYVEFVRGRYKVEKPEPLTYLFTLMREDEINKIKLSLSMEDGFEYLWSDLWGKKANHLSLEHNKRESKSKYKILKNIGVDGPEIGLHFIAGKVKPRYNINEWGFPKGRRHRNETDRECAIREFMEESGYARNDFEIIEEINPIIEELTGTNGVKYRHVYYIAELIIDKLPRKDVTESQKDEVGDIAFLNLGTASQTIRNYHKEKINLLTALASYYFDVVYNMMNKIRVKRISSCKLVRPPVKNLNSNAEPVLEVPETTLSPETTVSPGSIDS